MSNGLLVVVAGQRIAGLVALADQALGGRQLEPEQRGVFVADDGAEATARQPGEHLTETRGDLGPPAADLGDRLGILPRQEDRLDVADHVAGQRTLAAAGSTDRVVVVEAVRVHDDRTAVLTDLLDVVVHRDGVLELLPRRIVLVVDLDVHAEPGIAALERRARPVPEHRFDQGNAVLVEPGVVPTDDASL